MKINRKRTQSQLVLQKAVTNVKEKLKTDKKNKELEEKRNETLKKKNKQRKTVEKVTLPKRGVVYIGHIPHGFYEEQMKSYFKQFGQVGKVRVARSKKTGRSMGYGYVEFPNLEVAKIAANTMNNYLMSGRLLKATYIPPEKQNLALFFGDNFNERNYPRLKRRIKEIEKNHKVEQSNKQQKPLKKSLKRLQKKLQSKGINIDIKPIDA